MWRWPHEKKQPPDESKRHDRLPTDVELDRRVKELGRKLGRESMNTVTVRHVEPEPRVGEEPRLDTVGVASSMILQSLTEDGPQGARELATRLTLPEPVVNKALEDLEFRRCVEADGNVQTGRRGRPPRVWCATSYGDEEEMGNGKVEVTLDSGEREVEGNLDQASSEPVENLDPPEPDEEPEGEALGRQESAIVTWLRENGPGLAGQIAADLNRKPANVSTRLRQLEVAGLVRRTGETRVAGQGSPQVEWMLADGEPSPTVLRPHGQSIEQARVRYLNALIEMVEADRLECPEHVHDRIERLLG